MAQRVDIQYVQFYTQGSAARKVAPAISVHTGALPQVRKHKRKNLYVDPVAVIGIAVAVCMLVMMLVGVSQLRQAQQNTVAMEQYVEQLQQENKQLQVQFDEECDLEAIKNTALALGMVPGESVENTLIHVEVPQEPAVEQTNLWQRIGTFLTGLFA